MVCLGTKNYKNYRTLGYSIADIYNILVLYKSKDIQMNGFRSSKFDVTYSRFYYMEYDFFFFK